MYYSIYMRGRSAGAVCRMNIGRVKGAQNAHLIENRDNQRERVADGRKYGSPLRVSFPPPHLIPPTTMSISKIHARQESLSLSAPPTMTCP
jgi:hypothetical protein